MGIRVMGQMQSGVGLGSLLARLPLDAIKINVDGAFIQRTGEAAVGVIARSHEGQAHIMAWRLLFRCRDVEEAEAIAILEGIRLADRWPNETHVVLETDCSSLASKLNGGVMDRSVTSALVLDIKEAMERRLSCSILKIERD
jgi:ribonuclease HI